MAALSELKSVAEEGNRLLARREQAIARQNMGGVPWFAVAWGLGNFAIWLALWPLVIFGAVPIWAAFPIATLNVILCYLPSHEAQHDIIGRKGTKWRWLNELVGHVSTIPLVLPYRAAKLTHLEHHKHTNDPERDPDYSMRANGPLHMIWVSLKNRQPGSNRGLRGYRDALIRIGRPDVVIDGMLYQLVFYGVLCAAAWAGYGLEALLLWWLPRHIGTAYIQFFLSWAPHHPATETGRYRNTRAWRSSLGNIASMGMQYHIVHHLHPSIPLTRTAAAYRELRPILEQRGCRLDDH